MAILVKDSFNRANTTASTTGLGQTETGQMWESYAANMAYISNNTAIVNNSDNGQVVNIGTNKFSVQVTFLTTTGNPQLILGVDKATSDRYVFVEYSSGRWHIFRRYGTWSELASGPTAAAIGDVIKAVCDGSSITIFRNGTQIMAATETQIMPISTRTGIGSGNGSEQFDDFLVEDLNTGQAYTKTLTDTVTITDTTTPQFTPVTPKYYLQMDGVDDKLVTPSITTPVKYIYMKVNIINTSKGYLVDYRTAISRYFAQSANNFNGTININGTDYATDWARITQIGNVLSEITINADATTTGAITLFARYLGSTTTDFLQVNVYDIKLLDSSKNVLAHYDMSTGNVNDTSGNGNHATLNSGTWVEDGTGGTPTGQAYTVNLSDAVAVADSKTKIAKVNKNDAITMSDTKAKLATKTKMDAITLSEVFSKITLRYKLLSDSILNTDNFYKLSILNKYDSIIINDSMSNKSSRFKTLNDLISFSESVKKINSKYVNDNIGVGESLNTGGNKSSILNDFVVITDTIKKFISRNTNDSIVISDSQNRTLNKFISLYDSISSAESLQKNGGNDKLLNDFITLSDTIFKKLFKAYTDSIITNEIENDKASKKLLDAISQIDNVSIFRGKVVNLVDFVNITETIKKSLSKIQIDNISASEIKNNDLSKKVFDSISVTDLLNKNNGKSLLLNESILITDTIFKSVGKIKIENILLIDAINKALGKNLFDINIMSDRITLFIPNVPEYIDIINFVLNINMEKSFNLNITNEKEFDLNIVTYKNFDLNI